MISPPSKDESAPFSPTKTELGGGPPSYSDATGSSSSSVPQKPPSNYLYFVQQNGSIKGSWVVDPDLSIPPPLLPSVPEGTRRKNLLLSSHNGSINADISLTGEQPGKALIETCSHNGSVKVRMSYRTSNKKFALSAISHNGAVSVFLPRDFAGPISFKNGNGTTSFSQAIEERLTTFSRQPKEGRAFLGDWVSTGYEGVSTDEGSSSSGGKDWGGDELRVESKNGSIKVRYNDEEETALGNGPFGWVAKWFGGDQTPNQSRPQTNPQGSPAQPDYPAGASYQYPSNEHERHTTS